MWRKYDGRLDNGALFCIWDFLRLGQNEINIVQIQFYTPMILMIVMILRLLRIMQHRAKDPGCMIYLYWHASFARSSFTFVYPLCFALHTTTRCISAVESIVLKSFSRVPLKMHRGEPVKAEDFLIILSRI